MAPMFLIALLAMASATALPDHGIWPDLDGKARIAAPAWALDTGPHWVRLDPTHRVVTVYQGGAAVVAYPLIKDAPATSLSQVLPLLRAEDAAELGRLLPAGVRVELGAPLRAEDHDGDGIVDGLDILLGSKKLVLNQAAYKEEYRRLAYPGGDVPRTEGVCTDTVVRALRNAGWDLQREIHEEAERLPRLYPLEKKPDANIDHRRVRMMIPWLTRHFTRVPPGQPLRPGDIIFLDTFPRKAGPDHVGIVSDHLGPSGQPLLVNNWTDGFVEQEMDLLPVVPVTHRFRAPGAAAPAAAPAPQR